MSRQLIGAGIAGVAAPAGYAALFTVSFKHDFYNAAGDDCPDLEVAPTPSCAKLMSRLGILLRRRRSGFGLYAPVARVPAMMSWIASQESDRTPGAGCWTRLTFTLSAVNAGFLGMTRLPMTTNPTQQNLYASNLEVLAGRHGLSMGAKPTLGREALSALTTGRLALAAADGGVRAVADISGAVVREATPRGGVADLDFNGLPYGRYTVVPEGHGGESAAAQSVIYGPGAPIHLGLIDLLLVPPTASTAHPEAFPLPRPGGAAPEVTPVALTLAFAARQTRWQYFVVSQKPGSALGDDLAVSGAGASFTRSNDALPTGAAAAVFTTSRPLPLRQVSPYAFRLTGHRRSHGGARDPVTVERLPVAPAAPVWPQTSGSAAMAGRSEIYVYV